MEKYKLGQSIGAGSQGVVRMVYRETKDGKFDVKAMKKIRCDSIKEANAAIKEMHLVLSLEHDHMVSYEELFFDQSKMQGLDLKGNPTEFVDEYICIIMPYFVNRDLQHFLMKYKEQANWMDEQFILDIMLQLCDFFAYFHAKGLIHRDLKPKNILVRHRDNPSELFDFSTLSPKKVSIHVADFGLSTSFSKDSLRSTTCGSPYYMAPEILSSLSYSSEVDMFSMGCLLVYLLTDEELPWSSLVTGQKRVSTFERIKDIIHDRNHSQSWLTILSSLLSENPEKRLTASTLKSHLHDIHVMITTKKNIITYPLYWTNKSTVQDVTKILKDDIQKLFLTCCNSKALSSGLMTYSTLVVSRIFRIENKAVWKSYVNFSKGINAKSTDVSVVSDKVPMIASLYLSTHEKILFHGTKPNAVDAICDGGFDVSQAPSKVLHFSDMCSRSDQYVKPNYSGEYPMFVSRVQMSSSQRILKNTFYRDFEITHSFLAYPEFLVWYKRE